MRRTDASRGHYWTGRAWLALGDLPGKAGATPCVWGEHVFLTSIDGDKLLLMCFGTDGKALYNAAVVENMIGKKPTKASIRQLASSSVAP